MPTIRIDEEVWAWLKKHARPLEDTPNTVMRRIAGLDSPQSLTNEQNVGKEELSAKTRQERARVVHRKTGKRVMSGLTGQQLNNQWDVGVKHPLYHKEGTYYNHLKYFPGALFDPCGYVLFKTEKEYVSSSYLQHGKQLHVPGGISSMPNYVRRK